MNKKNGPQETFKLIFLRMWFFKIRPLATLRPMFIYVPLATHFPFLPSRTNTAKGLCKDTPFCCTIESIISNNLIVSRVTLFCLTVIGVFVKKVCEIRPTIRTISETVNFRDLGHTSSEISYFILPRKCSSHTLPNFRDTPLCLTTAAQAIASRKAEPWGYIPPPPPPAHLRK